MSSISSSFFSGGGDFVFGGVFGGVFMVLFCFGFADARSESFFIEVRSDLVSSLSVKSSS